MINAIIIDDEPKIRKVIQIKLEQFCPDIKVVETASNVQEGYQKIISIKPQLIFLDISMPGASGFQLLDMFEELPFEVIFITGYNEYALDALKVSAVDYLLKPVKNEDLVLAVSKAQVRINNQQDLEMYKVLKHNVNRIGDQDAKIAISNIEGYDIIRISDIIRCEGWNKYTKIHLANGQILVSSNNIGSFKERLEPFSFYACHKSHIINKKRIKRYLKEGTIILSDDSSVPLARRRKEDFLENELSSILSQ